MLQSDTLMRATKQSALIARLTLFLGVLAVGAQLMAQTNIGTTSVGSTTSKAVSVRSTTTGTVNSVEVLTVGAPNLDYKKTSDTCTGKSFSATGQTCSVTVSFTPAGPGLRIGAVVLLGSSGNVLGSTFLQGTGTGGLASFNPPGVSVTAGSGYWTFVGDGGPATSAGLYLPAAVAVDGAGNVYIADSQHHLVRMVSSGNGATIQNSVTYPQAGYIVTVAGNGKPGWAGDGLAASDSTVEINDPSGLAVDGAGNLYIADTGNNVVRMINAATGVITTVAGNGTAADSGDNGPATQASLDAPAGVAVDAVGNLYIADTSNHKIRAICASGTGTLFGVACGAAGDLITVAGDGATSTAGAGGFSGDNGPAASAELNFPYAPAFDAKGNMYIPDSNNDVVRMVNPTGTITTIAGTGQQPGYGGDNGPALGSNLQTPTSIAIDPAQNILICDSGNSAIRKIYSTTGIITSEIANNFEYVGAGPVLKTTSLYGQKGIALDGMGNIFAANTLNMQVSEFLANAALLDFSANPIFEGNTSAPLDQTIENDGNDTVAVSSVTAGTNAAYQASSTTCVSASPLSIDAQCIIAAEFSPSTAGNPLLGTLTIDGQTANNPLILTIAGDSPSSNSTALAITSSQNPVPFGQSLTISGSVNTGNGTGTPTGTLTFYDGANILQANVALNALASGSFSISTLSVGNHSITAKYSGDSVHTASTSNTMIQQVTESTAVVLTASSNPAILGTPFTLTAKVTAPSGGGVNPDGLVAFYDGTTVLGTASLNASGSASLKVSTISQGAHSLTAQYGGDATKFIDPSTSAPLSLNAVAVSSLTVESSLNPSTFGIPVTFTATLSSSGPIAPTGSLMFLDGGQSIGSAAMGQGGVASLSTSALAVGSHKIAAAFTGNQDINAITSAAITQNVTEATTATVLTVSPAQPAAGTSATLTASVSPVSGSGTITGTVKFTDGASALGSSAVGTNGKASIAVVLTKGTHSLKATYGGDADDSASASAVVTLNVAQSATQVALTSSASPALILGTVTFTASVTGPGAAPTGSVVFSIDGKAGQPVAIDATGTATLADSSLIVGSHSILASYSGDANNLASSSNTFNQVVTAIPTTTLLNTSATGGLKPQPILIGSVEASFGPTPTGTITFSYGSTVLGVLTLDDAASSTLAPQLTPGTYNIVASYSGDRYHAPSVSSVVAVNGTLLNFDLTVDPNAITIVDGQTGTVSITLTPDTGFSDTIQMGCLGLPTNAWCHFSSGLVPLQAGKNATIQLVINTELLGSSTASATSSVGPTMGAALMFPSGLLGWLIWRRRLRTKGIMISVIALALAISVSLSGCGPSVSFTEAPRGTYTVRIGGTGQNTGAIFFQNVTLTIK